MKNMGKRSCQKVYDAVGSVPGKSKFSNGSSGFSGLQEFATSHKHNKLHANKAEKFPVEFVNVRTPTDILHQTQMPSNIDYLSLDVEGSEMDILKSFPFDKHCIRYATIETNGDKEKEKEVEAFMAERGYTFLEHVGVDHHFTNSC